MSRPRIALNMTTLNQGGVLQRAVSFIRHLETDFSDFQWTLLLSPRMQIELAEEPGLALHAPQYFSASPARDWGARRAIERALDDLDADLVFTFGGPSYLRVRQPELMGVTDGWVTHASAEAFRTIASPLSRQKLRYSARYKLGWVRRADHWIAQTDTARRGLAERGRLPLERIHLVPNVVAKWYHGHPAVPRPIVPDANVRILYLAAAYEHKRHDLLPEVCDELRRRGLNEVKFTVTIPPASKIWQVVRAKADRLGVGMMIDNRGPVPVTAGPQLYAQHQLCFVPTVLETFTATYVEAMATATPILTSDLDFAHEACGEAALYFDPASPADAADQICRLVSSPALIQQQCERGRQRLLEFPDTQQQTSIYRDILHSILSRSGRG